MFTWTFNDSLDLTRKPKETEQGIYSYMFRKFWCCIHLQKSTELKLAEGQDKIMRL